jgi:DNA polymerase I
LGRHSRPPNLIAELDREYGVYDGRSFRTDWFEQLLARLDIPWPRLESGRLNLQDKTFRAMATSYPVLNTLRELRASLSSMRLKDIAVGRDGRHRTLLSAFRASSGRNQPSNVNDPRGGKKSVFIFGPATWVRGLIKPPPGFGISYIDYEQQEFGIAAAMSGDPAMLAAYQSGDPYLAFAKQAGAVPPGATKETHGAIRELYKQCVLGIQYGMGEHSLALRIGGPPALARKLLSDHRRVYRRFWEWIERTVNNALLFNRTRTVFGWQIHIDEDFNPRSLQNFPMQSHGSEMLRLACCLATERRIEVCAPVHDALLICAPLNRLDDDIAATRAAMAEASRAVLTDLELRTEAATVRWPDRFMDEKRGRKMWDVVVRLADELRDAKAVA